MFDIVSKNKKLSFIISFIHDNISSTQNTCKELFDFQAQSRFIQKKINIHVPTHKRSFFKYNKTTRFNSVHQQKNRTHTYPKPQSNPVRTQLQPDIQLENNFKKHFKKHTLNHTQSDKTAVTKRTVLSKDTLYTIDDHTIILNHIHTRDYLVAGLLICIDSNFTQTAHHLQLEYIKTLKYKMALELDTHNLYSLFLYNKIRSLKKTVLQSSLLNDKDIQYNLLYRYLGDYFNVNFILIIDNIFIQYFNKYKDKRICIIIYKNGQEYSIDTHDTHDEHIYNNTMDISQFIKYPGQTFKDFNKLKLGDIQTIATRKQISIIKSLGKKKTKKELIETILNIHN